MSELRSISIRFLILFGVLNVCLGQQCGVGNTTTKASPSRIVGGQNAGKLEWPWMAFLEITFQSSGQQAAFLCGGSLISDQWVVTAAHCVEPPQDGYRLTAVSVTLGEYNTNTNDGTEVRRSASEVFTDNFNANTIQNDIALIKLRQKLDLNGKEKYLRPICIPSDDSKIDGNQCMATGWGATREGGQEANILQEVRLPVIENNYCSSVWGRNFRSQYQLCAGYKQGGKDTCQGDSGGPLNCPLSNGVWVLEGITSYGNGCAEPRSPGVYTRVSAYRSWIQSVTGLKL